VAVLGEGQQPARDGAHHRRRRMTIEKLLRDLGAGLREHHDRACAA